MSFRSGDDDLGSFCQLGLQLTSGRLVLLARHDDEPNEGTSLYIDSSDSVRDAVLEVSSALGLWDADFVLIYPADDGV